MADDSSLLLQHIKTAWNYCSWGNRRDTPEDWLRVVEHGTEEEKRWIFGILFRELPDILLLVKIFRREVICQFLQSYTKPLSRSFLERRRKVLRSVICGISEPIPELDWIQWK